MIEKAMAVLAEVQRMLNTAHDDEEEEYESRAHSGVDAAPDWRSRLFVADIGGRLAVEYYGHNYEERWDTVQTALASAEVAPHIALLRLSGPDDGANGLRSWDFTTLIGRTPYFPHLTHFHVEPTEPSDHNSSVVEDGQLPTVLAMMPHLRRLTLPQAPEPACFALAFDDLCFLRIGMEHLAQSGSLPALVKLDFADSLGPWLNTTPQPLEWTSTPFSHFEALLRSNAVPNMAMLFLRNTKFTKDQFQTLQSLRRDLQLAAIISPPHVYVRHWDTTRFPYRHVLPVE